jgi:hypothetical protein
MITRLLKRFGMGNKPQEEVLDPLDTIRNFIKETQETDIPFSTALARRITLTVTIKRLNELSPIIIKLAPVVSRGIYIPDELKRTSTPVQMRFDDYITDGDELIHPVDWFKLHTHVISKLINSLEKDDPSETDYYKRHCNYVVTDLLALVKSIRVCHH